ncbi:MAG: BlaI/MecI/CopY family transcriptional regulator [Rubripirellula sp.]
MKLTSGELDLMDLLWRHERLTLAEAHEAFGAERIGYTTMQTRLNRLVEKGLAEKSNDRPTAYAPAVERRAVRAGHLDDVLERLTDGSVVPLVAHLVRDRKIDRKELAERKRLVRQAELDLRDQSSSHDADVKGTQGDAS